MFTTDQFSESIFDVTSSGYIERDQQGQQNSFDYNYWSSPVSIIQSLENNKPYSIVDILRDGKDSSNPKTITFGDGAYFADGSLTSPIKISNRWIWTYNSVLTPGADWENYWQWKYIGSTSTLKVGDGFTMKGTGGIAPITSTQNYVFIGKPNSGTILLNLGLGKTYLAGNPYPSALDADEFIKDNLHDCVGCKSSNNKFSGVLYFWDHFGLSNNHLLAQYDGGYAMYTLAGGVVGVNNSPRLPARISRD